MSAEPGQAAAEPRITLLAAPAGAGRRTLLEERLRRSAERGARASFLPATFERGGPWAGVRELLLEILPDLERADSDLLQKHDYELVNALPALRRRLKVRNPNLTDTASDGERVRNYPSDRAFRIVHGLIDLLEAWKLRHEPRPWVLACDGFEAGGALARTFFRELMRRRGESLGLRLLVTAEPARAADQVGWFNAAGAVAVEWPALGDGVDAPIAAAELGARAEALEREVGGDPVAIEDRLPELIALWSAAGRPERAFRWQVEALSANNSLGFYDDAVRYGLPALEAFHLYGAEDRDLHWRIFIKLFMCYVALNQPETAFELAQREALGRIEDPELECRLDYLIGMLYARYFKPRDLALAEEYLDHGLEALARSQASPAEVHFQTVFNRNGLAMIRHFQGRFAEALELCREGFERLQAFLGPETHRLHRSVLLYNMAQVYATFGEHQQAIEQFSAAMEMDPNYSEYFNERGNVYLKLGRYREALDDYLRAIELSPPYREVNTNLGQCHRLLGDAEAAIAAYTRALDLEPDQVLPLVGRAQAHEARGDAEAALADYSAALKLQPEQPEVLANRAVLLYERGDLAASLADLDRAVALAPERAELFQNRAVLWGDLGRLQRAIADLERYLSLAPQADDRPEVEARLAELGRLQIAS